MNKGIQEEKNKGKQKNVQQNVQDLSNYCWMSGNTSNFLNQYLL